MPKKWLIDHSGDDASLTNLFFTIIEEDDHVKYIQRPSIILTEWERIDTGSNSRGFGFNLSFSGIFEIYLIFILNIL
jgi:hypothetical protein